MLDKEKVLEDFKIGYSREFIEEKLLKGKYDCKNHKELCTLYVGKEIKNSFCNGFFGRVTFDLKGAIITRVYRDNNEEEILVEVLKTNGRYDYGVFDGRWDSWEIVYTYLSKWAEEGNIDDSSF